MADNFNILDFDEYPQLWPSVDNESTRGIPNPFFLSGGSGLASTADRLYLIPTILPKNIILANLSINVTVADAGAPNVKAGIYNVENAEPNKLLGITGAIDVTTTGTKLNALVANVRLNAGIYFLALASSSSTTAFMQSSSLIATFRGFNSQLIIEEVAFHNLTGGWSTFPDNPTVNGSLGDRNYMVGIAS